MTTEVATLEVRNIRQWRTWLARNHASSPGVWLVFHKRTKSLAYEDSVRDALCFGWIDSLIKRIDDDRYARKFTPRKPTSKWSDTNRRRWAELEAAGLLEAPGLAASPTRNTYAPRPQMPREAPDYVVNALKESPKAWATFESLPQRERCRFVYWIETAKRPETRQRRIRESVALLAAGQRLGLK